jgi:hypothetical protein
MNVRAPIARALRRAADFFYEEDAENESIESDGRPDGYVTDISAETPIIEEISPGPAPIVPYGEKGFTYL